MSDYERFLFTLAKELHQPIHVVESWPYSDIKRWQEFFTGADTSDTAGDDNILGEFGL